jgi:hypothetical protein
MRVGLAGRIPRIILVVSNMPEPEFWLRGRVAGVPPLLQPVAHSLLQAREDVAAMLAGLTPAQLWARPGGAASVGFHVRHLGGALERLFTYARGESLTPPQLDASKHEGEPADPPATAAALLRGLDAAIDRALDQIRGTSPESLLEARAVGRRALPSNVLGLMFHAAEHATRHAGQAITTAKIVTGQD